MKFITIYFFIHVSLLNVIRSHKNFGQQQLLTGKKIQFTGNSTQFLKFEVELPNTPEFVMCLWYKPDTILERNILFFYGNADQQHILWEIKKKHEISFLVLTISKSIVMEEKIENLQLCQWNHICQYWQGSTGFWTFFLNNQLISFGYLNTSKKLLWDPKKENTVAAISHPHTKGTLHGEVFGFHMISTNLLTENFQQSDVSHYFHTNTMNSQKSEKSKQRKRQIMPTNPVNKNSQPLRFHIRNALKFIRRMVSLVTVPVFRFAVRLIQPWRRRLVSLRPTSSNQPKVTAATKIITNFQPDLRFKNETKLWKTKKKEKGHNGAQLENPTKSYYEVTTISLEARTENLGESLKVITNHYSTFSSSANESNGIQKEAKCFSFKKKLKGNLHTSTETNFVTTSSENSINRTTPTGSFLLPVFSQILYLCCTFRHENVLISWEDTYANLYEVVVADAKGCGKF